MPYSLTMLKAVTLGLIALLLTVPDGAAQADPNLPTPSAAPIDRSIGQSLPQALPANPQPVPIEIQSDYVLGAGDHLIINVFGYEEYSGDRTILPDGTITVPLLGSIMAADRTTDQLATELTNRLQPYLVEPTITVSLSILRPVSVNVAGEVLRPGRVQLQSLSNGLQPTPEQIPSPTLSVALQQAGGITQHADIRQVVVKRRRPGGAAESMTVNLWEAISSANAPPEIILQDGDSIYIPRVMAGSTDLDRRRLAQSSFSPATVRVRVVGEVTAPGEVQVPPNSSLSSAVAIAGGPTEDARLREVSFIRLNEEGQIERQTLDLRDLSDNFQVQDGDVIIVPKRGTSAVLDLAGRVFTPLSLILNLFK
jgi:polysaccharide biosynthesis/export protein